MPRAALSSLPLWFGLFAGLAAPLPAQTAPATAGEQIVLTAEERAWVAAHPVVRVGHDAAYAPYALQDAAGQIVGIDPDYLELLARSTGLKFQAETRRDWGVMIEDFKAGQVDVLMSLGRTPEREQYLAYTHAYTFTSNVIIIRNDAPNLAAVGDLKGRQISLPRGHAGLRQCLEQNIPGAVIVEYADSAECFEAVARGDIYAAIDDVADASYLIKAHGLTTLRFGSVLPTTTEIYMGVRKDWPVLLAILNKALVRISAEDRQRINDHWIVVDASAARRLWWHGVYRAAAWVAVVVGIIFLLGLFHNRRLARELAERRRIQAELEQTRDRLVLSNKERSELMHMVAHDLRGPLSAIQLGVELLRFQPPLSDARREQTTRRVSESADQMARLINDLLSAQNVEAGHYALELTAGDVGKLVRGTIAALDTIAQHKRISVTARLPDAPVPLTTDFIALQQVIDNLLSNALKYSPLDTRVEIAVAATATHCRFEVRDEGLGVKPEEREKIFEKYTRGSAQPTHGEVSTGLGLWIVRRFVTALHGRVWCEAGVHAVGSVFVVELPLAPPAE